VSNPGDRWRKTWLLPALLLAGVGIGVGVATAQLIGSGDATPVAVLTGGVGGGATQVDGTGSKAAAPGDVQLGWVVDNGRIQLIGAVANESVKTALFALAETRFGAGNVDDQIFVSPQGLTDVPPTLITGLQSVPTTGNWIIAWDGTSVRLQGAVPTGADRDAIRGVADAVGPVAVDELTIIDAEPSTTAAAAPVDTTAPVGAPIDDATVNTIEQPVTSEPASADQAPAETVPAPTETVPADAVVVENPSDTPTETPAEETTTVPTNAPPVTTPEEAAVIEEIRADLSLEGIEFASGSANIRAESRDVLDRVAATLAENPTVRVEVGGHTDNFGDPAFNRDLSGSRATAVVNYLVDKGIAAERLVAVGFGPDKPLLPNDSSANRKKNRRIEFTIL
jgi:outer membrane protein OmpA-like peptidoglycan-associated protein